MSSFKFWKPGTAAPGEGLSEERSRIEEKSTVVYNPNASLSISQQRIKLPVFQHRNHILYLLEKYQTLVIVGETGCGKSTQIPQYLYEAGWAGEGYTVAVTQPRRVAAVMLANRVSEEMGIILGNEVGYCVRFDDCSDEKRTRIKFLTDGLLVREMMKDPLLSKYSVIMLDEAHERTLHTDIVAGLLKKVQQKRPDLRIIVSSATLDAEMFMNFFNANDSNEKSRDTATILSVEGRMFPVDIHYCLDPVPDYLKCTVETVMKIHKNEKPGDILAFLTGMDEVERVVSMLIEEARQLKNSGSHMKMRVLPMHGSLPYSEQMKIFERTGSSTRKIVVATNIAEASITVNGVCYIVDCGFVKLRAYNPKTGIDSLVVVPVSQASAEQRAGRSGRVRSGKAYRLYTEESFRKLHVNTVPEMQRTNMASVVLQLKALGIDNILRFHFLSAPPAQNMVQGVELLFALGVLNDAGQLTNPLGFRMAEFPLNPMYAKMLLAAEELECTEEALTIVSMMQIQNVFITLPGQKVAMEKARRKFSAAEGDHISMLNIFNTFVKFQKKARWCHEHFLNYKGLCRALEIREQLKRILSRFKVKMKSCEGDVETICRCITAGLFANAAQYHYSGVYKSVRENHSLHIHPTSVLYTEQPAKWVVFNEIVQTSKDYMRDVTVIQPEWLYSLAPHYYKYGPSTQ